MVSTTFRSHSRRPGAVSVKKSLGQRRGVEHVARWPRRQPRQVRQRACAPWEVGRFSTGRSARGLRATGVERDGHGVRSRCRRPGAVSVKKSLGQQRGMERATRLPRRQPRQVRQRARAPWAVGWFSTGRSARPRGIEHSGHDVPKPQPPTWRGVGEEEPRPTAWDGARRALAAKTTTPSPPASACSVGRRPVLHGAKRARAARHGNEYGKRDVRSRSRRPGAVSVKKSLGQRRGVERAARWPRRQPRQVRQSACAPWAVGRFSTGRSARGSRATEVRRGGHGVSKPQPPTCRGVGEEEPRPTAWGGARPALAAKTTTPSPPARKGSVGGRPVLHGAKRARAARHGSRTRRSRRLETAAADLRRCRCGRASANGVGWTAPRVGREDNHAKSASAHVLSGPSAGSPRGEARAGRAPRESNAAVTTSRNCSRRPGAVSVKKSLGQRRGVERAARWPRRQPRQVRQRARAPWAVGRFSTGRSARRPRATGFERGGNDVLKLQPPTWRVVGEEEPRPTAWDGARRALAAKTTTPSPPARTCSVGRRLVLQGARRARAARHGDGTR